MADSRPNILFLFSDQHRADALGCAGHAHVKTPNLDRLAASGTRFERTYAAAPI
ncbi:MAG: sulfatase-like hydrolase/transferase, partial [Planctomycetota bacterium]